MHVHSADRTNRRAAFGSSRGSGGSGSLLLNGFQCILSHRNRLEALSELREQVFEREPFEAGVGDETNSVHALVRVSGLLGPRKPAAVRKEYDVFAHAALGLDNCLDPLDGFVERDGSFPDADGAADGGAAAAMMGRSFLSEARMWSMGILRVYRFHFRVQRFGTAGETVNDSGEKALSVERFPRIGTELRTSLVVLEMDMKEGRALLPLCLRHP